MISTSVVLSDRLPPYDRGYDRMLEKYWVSEILIYLNHLMRLSAPEYFIQFSRRKSFKTYMSDIYFDFRDVAFRLQ
jgi:hypothetical protein